MRELRSVIYADRTAQNVADSDGTLIISNGSPTGGTRETVERSIEMQKPYLLIDCGVVSIDEAIRLVIDFISTLSSGAQDREETVLKAPSRHPSTPLGMTVLNVAGPRLSQWPEGHALTYQIVSAILRRISGQEGAN